MRTEQRQKIIGNNFYQLLFNHHPTMYFIVELVEEVFQVFTVNYFGAQNLGYTVDELEDQPVAGVIYPEDQTTVFSQLKECYNTPGKIFNWEFRKIRKNGEVLWVRESACAARIDSSILILINCEDISKLKELEEVSRALEEKYRLITENSADAISVLDMNLNFKYISPSVWDIRGYTVEEALAQTLEQVVVPESLIILRKAFEEEMKLEASGTAEPKRTLIIELEEYTKDGSTIWTENNLAYMRDEDQKPIGIIAVTRDITARKKMEADLRLKNLVFDVSLVANSIADAQGIIIQANEAFLRTWGYSNKNEVIGKPIAYFFAELDDEAAAIIKVLDEKNKWEGNFTARKKDGSTFVANFIATTVFDKDGKKIGYQSGVLDVTERKRAKEEKKKLQKQLESASKMEAIGTLAGGIAHDFNNLLMGIQGYISLILLKTNKFDVDYERLKLIETLIESGGNLTRQLLEFARGGEKRKVELTDINSVLQKTSNMFGRTKKEIIIQEKFAEDLWSVEVDRGQMEQVFMNLYLNAWQAMPSGGKICLETQNVFLHKKMYVKITIADTGTGIDEEIKRRIFEPFFTTKEMGRGTGLGLAMAYGIIHGHKGTIDVSSSLGFGATFSICLPASKEKALKEKIEIRSNTRGTETILLVDDEEMIQKVTKEILESIGYKVYVVRSGPEAIATYREKGNEINLIILDIIMPGMSGGETFDCLRKINPLVKILLSSGYNINGEAQNILDRGCNGFIQKPFRSEELSSKVRKILDSE